MRKVQAAQNFSSSLNALWFQHQIDNADHRNITYIKAACKSETPEVRYRDVGTMLADPKKGDGLTSDLLIHIPRMLRFSHFVG
jgi:hypothetical protein